MKILSKSKDSQEANGPDARPSQSSVLLSVGNGASLDSRSSMNNIQNSGSTNGRSSMNFGTKQQQGRYSHKSFKQTKFV